MLFLPEIDIVTVICWSKYGIKVASRWACHLRAANEKSSHFKHIKSCLFGRLTQTALWASCRGTVLRQNYLAGGFKCLKKCIRVNEENLQGCTEHRQSARSFCLVLPLFLSTEIPSVFVEGSTEIRQTSPSLSLASKLLSEPCNCGNFIAGEKMVWALGGRFDIVMSQDTPSPQPGIDLHELLSI